MTQQFILPRNALRAQAISRISKVLASLDHDQAWRLEIHEHKLARSTAQNRYIWGCVYPTILKAGKLEGWTAEEVHEYCLGEHFGWETVSGFGRKKIRPLRRSAKLNKMEFADFIAFIQQRMAEHGIYIEDPDPNYWEKQT